MNIYERINDDENDYLQACKEAGEAPRRTAHGHLDCYGEHARTLREFAQVTKP